MPVQVPPVTLPWSEQKNRNVPRWRNRLETDAPSLRLREYVQLPP